MRPTQVTQFQASLTSALRRPWKPYKDGTLFYGSAKTGNKRVPLTGKQGNKNFYKGTRSTGVGSHTKHGGYVINYEKVRTFVVPANLSSCDLKPYVSSNVAEIKHQFKGYQRGAIDGNLYVDKLKEYVENGETEYPLSHNYLERG